MGSISPADLMIPVNSDTASHLPKASMGTENEPTSNRAPMSTEKGTTLPPTNLSIMRCVGMLRVLDISLRSVVVAFMVVSLSAMFTSTQHTEVRIFGFTIPVSMRWNRSQPFEFLVVAEIMIGAYALILFVYQSVVLVKKAAPTRRSMVMQLVADQVCTYLVLAAAAAAAGASRTNKSAFRSLGVQNIHVPGVCTLLDKFCNRATIAIIFTLLATCASAISAAIDVYLLTLTQ